MKKLASLREHLLSSPLQLQADDLLTFVEQGKIIAYQGADNQHFELRYTAHIIITDYSGDADRIAYLILQWLQRHQPHCKEDAIAFEADILSQSAVDLALKIALSEIIKVRVEEEGVYLQSCAVPNLAEILLPRLAWEMTAEHKPDGQKNG